MVRWLGLADVEVRIVFIEGTRLLTPKAYYEATKDQVRFRRVINGPFEEKISSGQRKRIAKCKRELFECVETARLTWCYEVVANNRARKGRPYSMTLDDWQAMDALPDTVYCFAVSPAAAALTVRLLPDLLYVQAWGDVAGFEEYSPVALLCKGIYEWCGQNGIKTLDIGTADEPGLIDFKKRLGFTC